MSLAGKIALVTGASKGIGKSIVEKLAAEGASVVINYSRDAAPADELVKKLGADRSFAIKADVSSVSESQCLVSETVARFGKIDILVLNAGVMPNKDLAGTTEEDFDRTFGVNVKGPYFIAQACTQFLQGVSSANTFFRPQHRISQTVAVSSFSLRPSPPHPLSLLPISFTLRQRAPSNR